MKEEKQKEKAPEKPDKKDPVNAKTKDQQTDTGIDKVKFSLRRKFYLILIPLVGLIITVMAFYFVYEESNLLTDQIVKSAEREIEHLMNTASLSLVPKGDILSLIDALKKLEKVNSIKYAYVFDAKNALVQTYNSENKDITQEEDAGENTDKKEKPEYGTADVTEKAFKYANIDKPLLQIYPDPKDTAGKIYDFSTPVLHPIYKDMRIGTVRLGLSDKIIRVAIAKITRTIALSAVIFISIAIVGSMLLARIIINPVRRLSQGAIMIGSGNLDYKIDINTSDELGRLAFEFNEMTGRLKKAKNMEVEQRVMQEQLDLAKEIQEGLNPMSFYEKNGVQIKGYTRAAKGVGGDYFDYIDIDDNKVGALISDVSGKGIPASLVMVMIRTVFVTYVKRKDVDCSSVVTAINDSLSADFAIDKFATLFFLIFDRSTGEVSFSNAGHGPLFAYRSKMKACSITKLEGMPIGIMEDAEYPQTKVKLSEGDIIVLYTDGITEMRNSLKEEYGRKRLQDMLIRNSGLNADQIVELIVNDVDAFRGTVPPHDDMTLLVLKRA